MSAETMRFKAMIKAIASERGIPAQVVLQNFMFERFFERLSRTSIRENLVLKGGALVSQYLGLESRTTMDIDVTLRKKALDENNVRKLLDAVFAIKTDDGISWNIQSVSPIRQNDMYGGFRVKISAFFESIEVPFSIDISTGDAITPGPTDFFFKSEFTDNAVYRLKAYPIETVLAEKIESIFTLGVLSTRPRDYYDVYMLTGSVAYDEDILRGALSATLTHRNSTAILEEWRKTIAELRTSSEMASVWKSYGGRNKFAENISFTEVLDRLESICSKTMQ